MKVCIWFSCLGEYTPPRSMILFDSGDLMIGMGPSQKDAKFVNCKLRDTDIDHETYAGYGLEPDIECWTFSDETNDEGFSAVFVDSTSLGK